MSGRQARARRHAADAALERLWAQVPSTGCKGLCAHSCGPIGMSEAERDRIQRRHGLVIRDTETRPGTLDCPALVDGQCSVYADRPMVCRLWGATDPMPCPHGCVPFGGRLSDAAGAELMRASLALDGPVAVGGISADVLAQVARSRSPCPVQSNTQSMESTRRT